MSLYISAQVIYRWIINAVALVIVVSMVGGVSGGAASLLLAAAVLGFVNAWIRPIILLLTLPINILSLGLFTLVINGFMLWITSALVPGFTVVSFSAAVWAGLLFSIVSSLISLVVKPL